MVDIILTILLCVGPIGGAGVGTLSNVPSHPAASSSSAPVPVNDLPADALLCEDEDALGSEAMVVDAETGGLSHIKLSQAHASASFPPLAFDFEAGVAASLAVRAEAGKQTKMAEQEMQTALTKHEAGALLNTSTPADGHCLFHALKHGGLARFENVPCQLTVAELRCMALSMATPEQLEVAAASTGEHGVSVDRYKEQMVSNLWGDNLMVALLAQTFGGVSQ